VEKIFLVARDHRHAVQMAEFDLGLPLDGHNFFRLAGATLVIVDKPEDLEGREPGYRYILGYGFWDRHDAHKLLEVFRAARAVELKHSDVWRLLDPEGWMACHPQRGVSRGTSRG
jgi:hypothetical protein